MAYSSYPTFGWHWANIPEGRSLCTLMQFPSVRTRVPQSYMLFKLCMLPLSSRATTLGPHIFCTNRLGNNDVIAQRDVGMRDWKRHRC
jgi:hypothetical protein